MALADGSVSVDEDGNVTGSGFALALYNALAEVASVTIMAELAETRPVFAAGAQSVRERCAASANALAAVLNTQTKTATVAVAGVTVGMGSAVGTVT